MDIYNELKRLNIKVNIADPLVDEDEIEKIYGQKLTPVDKLKPADALILAVPHREIVDLGLEKINSWVKKPQIVFDVKGLLQEHYKGQADATYWRL